MIGTYYTENRLQTWFVENLSIARTVLSKFVLLNELLDSFRYYEDKRHRDLRNYVMFMSLPHIRRGISKENIITLEKIETMLQSLNVMSWNSNKLNYFKSRLSSEDNIQSASVVTELLIAYYMIERLGKENVELFPELDSGKFSDILVKLNDTNVFFEVGNLGESVPQSKIQRILDAAAEYLGKKIDLDCYLCLHADTAAFVVDRKGRIDVDGSISKINAEIDMIFLHELAGFHGTFNINDLANLLEFESKYPRTVKWLPSYDKELFHLIQNNNIVVKWLQLFPHKTFEKIKLIKSIIAGEMSTLLVEIHTKDLFPSKAAELERKSFLNHIIRNVEGHITENQLQPNAMNIIAVQGHHWTFGFNYNLFDISPIILNVRNFFARKKEKYLSGIALFGNDFEYAIYINNIFAEKESKLTEDNVLELGFKQDRIF
ncbi:MAG: hypothetical protein ACW99F_08030 [Candidatus Hodarchaeales archaeon]